MSRVALTPHNRETLYDPGKGDWDFRWQLHANLRDLRERDLGATKLQIGPTYLDIFELVRTDDAVEEAFDLVPAPRAVPNWFAGTGGGSSSCSVVVAIVERFQLIWC